VSQRHASTLSDKELAKLGRIRRADVARAYNFGQHGWSAEYMVTFMARELLELRCMLRDTRNRVTNQAISYRNEVDQYLGSHADGSSGMPDWEDYEGSPPIGDAGPKESP
jgi:hypothetical protein